MIISSSSRATETPALSSASPVPRGNIHRSRHVPTVIPRLVGALFVSIRHLPSYTLTESWFDGRILINPPPPCYLYKTRSHHHTCSHA